MFVWTGECKYDHRCFRCFEQHAIYNCTKDLPASSKMHNTTPLPTPVRFDVLEKQIESFENEKLQLLSAGFRKVLKYFFKEMNVH